MNPIKRRIGFDLDGVLCDQDVCQLRQIAAIPDEKYRRNCVDVYYKTRIPLLDPRTVMSRVDDGWIITNRGSSLHDVTLQWVNKWLPTMPVLFTRESRISDLNALMLDDPESKKILREVAAMKADMIKQSEMDIYWDDIEYVVLCLREMLPDVEIQHYGGSLLVSRL